MSEIKHMAARFNVPLFETCKQLVFNGNITHYWLQDIESQDVFLVSHVKFDKRRESFEAYNVGAGVHSPYTTKYYKLYPAPQSHELIVALPDVIWELWDEDQNGNTVYCLPNETNTHRYTPYFLNFKYDCITNTFCAYYEDPDSGNRLFLFTQRSANSAEALAGLFIQVYNHIVEI